MRDAQGSSTSSVDEVSHEASVDPGAALEPQTLVGNSAWTFAAQAIGYAINGAVAIYAIRTLSVTSYGHYATALALIAILTVFSELGLSTLTMREIASHPGRITAALGRGLRAVAVTGGAGIILVVPIALALGYRGQTLELVALAAPMILLQPVLAMLRAAFNARRVMQYAAQFSIVNAIVFGTVAVALLAAGRGASGLVVAIVTGYAVGAAIGTVLLARRLGVRASLRGGGPVSQFIRAAIAIAAIGGVGIIYDRVDVLLLSHITGPRETAFYSVPYTLVKLTWSIPAVIAAAFFPLFTKLRRESAAEAERSYFLLARIFLFLAIPTALALSIAAPDVVTLAFGDRYEHAAAPLSILAWTAVVNFPNYLVWYGLLAAERERHVLPVMLSGLALNVALNLFLIPAWGASGAATALLISETWAVAGGCWLIQRHVYRIPFQELLIQPFAAAALVALPALALAQVSHLLAGAVAGLACVLLLLVRYVTPTEWAPLTQPVRATLVRLRQRVAG